MRRGQNLNHDILFVLRKQGIIFTQRETAPIVAIPKKIGTTIESIIDSKLYNQYRSALKQYKLLFIDQILNASKTTVLEWCQTTLDPNSTSRRKTPNWYKTLQDKTNKLIDNNIITSEQNSFLQCTPITNIKTVFPHWVATKKNDIILIGKKQKKLSDQSVRYRHYHKSTEFSPLTPCLGCTHDVQQVIGKCFFDTNIQHTVQIPVYKSSVSISSKISHQPRLNRVRASPDSIQNALLQQTTRQSTVHKQPEVILMTHQEEFIRLENTFQCEITDLYHLHHICTEIATSDSITIYTDGSLSTWYNKPLMGFGWILTNNTDQQFQLKGQTRMHVSSSRAEITAIATALSITPRYCKVSIYTDSQVAINSIKATLATSHTRTIKCKKNSQLLLYIKDICSSRTLELHLHKVKAHSGVPLNEKADQLARIDPYHNGMVPETHMFTHNVTKTTCLPLITTWDNQIIEIPVKQLCKKITESKYLAQWRLLNRTRIGLTTTQMRNIHWKATYKLLHPTKISNDTTTDQDQQVRKFNLNIWYNELPTKNKLYERKPQLYLDNKIFKCHLVEDTIHPFICPHNNTNIHRFIRETIIHTGCENIHVDRQTQFSKEITKTLQPDLETIFIIKGIITNKLYYTCKKFIENTSSTYTVLDKAMAIIKNKLRELWQNRCNGFQTWKESKGITPKVEKQHKYSTKGKDPAFLTREQDIKDNFTHIVNTYIHKFIAYNTNIFGLLKINYSASSALAC
jgi:ribonuclease HI